MFRVRSRSIDGGGYDEQVDENDEEDVVHADDDRNSNEGAADEITYCRATFISH